MRGEEMDSRFIRRACGLFKMAADEELEAGLTTEIVVPVSLFSHELCPPCISCSLQYAVLYVCKLCSFKQFWNLESLTCLRARRCNCLSCA